MVPLLNWMIFLNFFNEDFHKTVDSQIIALNPGGGGGLLKYDLGRDVPLRLEK